MNCIYDVNDRFIERSLQEYPCRVCASYEEMLESDIDAVLLILPNFLHEEFTVWAVAAGKHVFVEKPIANWLDEAERMVAACAEGGVVLAVGHSDRHRIQNLVMADLLKTGALGEVCGFQLCNSHDHAKRGDKGWKTDPELAPCVPLMQLGIHQIDTLRSYFGEVEAVFSHHANVSRQFEMTDTTQSLLRFQNGVVGSLSCFYMVPATKVRNFYGTGARAIAGEGHIEILKEGDSEPTHIELSTDRRVSGDLRMLDAFAAAVLDETPFPTDGLEASRALAVVWTAIRSSELGREVSLEEGLEHFEAGYLRG